MCGIAGIFDRSRAGDRETLGRIARSMADSIAYRGPDASGVWLDAEAGVGLSHRRLAIVDLTTTGAQPMVSSDGRWIISYNGEIYNAPAIAQSLKDKGTTLRGLSDTEVFLESVVTFGLDATLRTINGMFAIALWDQQTRTLYLIRDRLGIKPLFYSVIAGGVLFASELKPLLKADLKPKIDKSAVASFLRYGYVPTPHAIFAGVEKVRPGTVVAVDSAGKLSISQYWSLAQVAEAGLESQLELSDQDAEERLHDLLADAVSNQMMSDVPLGAFLSGGIDSSTVAAFMVKAGRGPVRTFSIGFPDAGYDESAAAKAVANHLGTEHHELIVTEADALAVVPKLADMYDEPFADSSQIPTYLLSKMTRERVTVALSGDGGDELFAGYNRYALGEGALGTLAQIPAWIRKPFGSALDAIPNEWIDAIGCLLPASLRYSQPADKLKKLASILPLDRSEIYQRLISQCADPGGLAFGAAEYPSYTDVRKLGEARFIEQMQLLDMSAYLPDDILQKVDRASMAVSLEVRPPILDHRIVEFSWKLPRRFKIRNGERKWLLRRVVDRYVPRQLLDRPKMGFGVPLSIWLSGALRGWAEDLLDPVKLGGGLIDPIPVRRMWSEQLSGQRNWSYALWTILMFEAWRRRWANAAV